ncbi:MAG: hypothetical protein ACRDZ2_10675 [Ilumatobacteraceae bacterium]
MRYSRFEDLPDVLTIREAADFMRVSPGVAYGMARRYRKSNGREGLPVFMAGERMMRVAKLDLGRYMTGEASRAAAGVR